MILFSEGTDKGGKTNENRVQRDGKEAIEEEMLKAAIDMSLQTGDKGFSNN